MCIFPPKWCLFWLFTHLQKFKFYSVNLTNFPAATTSPAPPQHIHTKPKLKIKYVNLKRRRFQMAENFVGLESHLNKAFTTARPAPVFAA